MMYLDIKAVRERAIEVFGESRVLPWDMWPTLHGGAPDWATLGSIEVVHAIDDPFAWRGLVVRSQRGEKRAYRELLTQFGFALELLFERILPSPVVEDAVQDTLLAVHAKLSSCNPNRSILEWLMAVAVHQARANPQLAEIDLELG